MAKMYDEKKAAVLVTATYMDFDGDLEKWKDSFYQIWRYQLTYRFAYSINLRESRSSGVYVALMVKTAFKDNIIETMEDLGYREIKTDDEMVGLVYLFEHDELDDIEELHLDY